MAKRKTGLSRHSIGSDEDTHTDIAEEHSRVMAETLSGALDAENALSAIEYRRPNELKPSEFNEVFASQKTDEDWKLLRHALADARMITDPLLITSDGTVISGHSRLRIASDLLSEGFTEFERVPVRVFRRELNREEERRAVYLANLARFQIDRDQKLIMIAQIYPDFFSGGRSNGRPKKGDTVSPFKSDVASAMKVSPRQAQREKRVFLKAKGVANERGEKVPTVEDIQVARKARSRASAKGQRDSLQSACRPKVLEHDGAITIDGVVVLTIHTEALPGFGLSEAVVARRLKDLFERMACQ